MNQEWYAGAGPKDVNIFDRQWSFKMAVLDMLSTVLRKLPCERQLHWFMFTVLASTFFASLLSVFVECQDLRLNWKLFPKADQWWVHRAMP